MPTKIFRDPLYNYIVLDKHQDKWLLELLDSPATQRLRRIHQLGLSYFTYPGADHSRLSHSMGVLHLMQQALNHIKTIESGAQIDRGKDALLAAALLHDIGHGPFSHIIENVLGFKHEEWTCKIIEDPDSRIHEILADNDPCMPKHVASLIKEDNHDYPMWQKNLLSSQLDVDRLDYLRRDSLFTGADYGHFDWYRLLHSFSLYGNVDKWRDLVWPEKAKYAIEEFIFARYYMYENVYLHHTTRGFEKILEALFKYALQLEMDEVNVCWVKPIKDYLNSDDPPVKLFLEIEESTILFQIQIWRDYPNKILSDLAQRFLNRKGFAAFSRPPFETDDGYANLEEEIRRLLSKKGFTVPSVYFLSDDKKSKTYEGYYTEQESQHQGSIIAVRDHVNDEPVEISKLLPRLRAVTEEPPKRIVYYVPKEVRDEVGKLIDEFRTDSISKSSKKKGKKKKKKTKKKSKK